MNSTRRAIATWMLLSQRSYSTTTALIHNTRKYTPLSATQLIMNPLATWRTDRIPSSQLSYSSSAALMINNDSDSSSGSSSDDGPSPPQAQPSESQSESNRSREEFLCRLVGRWSTENAIDLVGYVDGPVSSGRCKFKESYGYGHEQILEEMSSDEELDEEYFSDNEVYFYFARTIIKQDIATSDSPSLPVIVLGKLARAVASHLKDKDRVYVSGELVGRDKDPRKYPGNVQVVACIFESTDDQYPFRRPSVNVDVNLNFWRDLVLNPKQWRDFRTAKLDGSVKIEHPDFKHKEIGHPLWVDTAPHWVHWVSPQLMPEHADRSKEPKLLNNQKKPQKGHESWKDLLVHTGKWKDDKGRTTR